jgi:hypothetical protein
MFDFDTFHPIHLSGLTLQCSDAGADDATGLFIAADALTDRALHTDD